MEDALLAHEFVPPVPAKTPGNYAKILSRKTWPVFAGMGLLFFAVGAAISVLSQHRPPPPSTAACQAKLVIIRHGEKPEKSEEEAQSYPHLSELGKKRAEYLSRCVQSNSTALPWGSPSVLIAAANQVSGSHRSVETLDPVAKVLKLKIKQLDMADHEGFVEYIAKHADCGGTVLVCWHHEFVADLVEHIGAPNYMYGFNKWPKWCNSASFNEPPDLPGSKCYDAVWQMPLSREDPNSTHWTVGWISALHEGFGGGADDPCSEDLAPIQ